MAKSVHPLQSRQTIGLFFTPDLLHNPKDMEEAISAAAENNFGIIIGFARHMTHNLFDRDVHDAVKAAAEYSRRCGLKFVMDMDWAHWGGSFAEKNTDMAMWFIATAETICMNGRFDVTIPYQRLGGPAKVSEICAVYGFDERNRPALLGEREYELRQESFSAEYSFPSMDDEQEFSPSRKRDGGYYLRLSGAVKDPAVRRVRFYVGMESYKYPDVANPAYLKAQSELLHMYEDVPLDGVAWTEPGKGSSFNGYKAGRGFLDFFKLKCGYDLRGRLLGLDSGMDAQAVQTRRDYYNMLNEMNCHAQYLFNEEARRIFGKDIFIGTHHTFSGMAIDLRCGCLDYFKLGKLLTAAFTDTGWDVTPHSETVFHYVLADSLRKELGKSSGYVNDWSRIPHVSWYDYYTRLKMIYRLDWRMILLGRYTEGHPAFPWDRHWRCVGENAGRLESFAGFIGRNNNPQSEMAVWHSWESLACLEVSRLHHVRLWMTCNYNLSEEALKCSRHYEYVSTEAIEGAEVGSGMIRMPGGSYRRLVLPYAVVMTKGMWNRILACVKAGVEIIFVGPPPLRLSDSGDDISVEFCKLCGVQATDFAQYDSWLKAHKPVPGFGEWEPEKADFSFPVVPLAGTETLADDDGGIIGVRNTKGCVTWLTALDPREQFFLHVPRQEPEGCPYPEHYGRGYFRILSGGNSREFVLVCISPLHDRLHEEFAFNDISFAIEGGAWAVLKIANGKIVETLTDSGTQVRAK